MNKILCSLCLLTSLSLAGSCSTIKKMNDGINKSIQAIERNSEIIHASTRLLSQLLPNQAALILLGIGFFAIFFLPLILIVFYMRRMDKMFKILVTHIKRD